MTNLPKLSFSPTTRNLIKPDRPLCLTKLLVPIDFSAGTKDVLCYAAAFARRFGASLTLLHVIKPICEIDFGYGSVVRRCQSQAVVDNIKARLNTLGKRRLGLCFKPPALVFTGSVEKEIVIAARQLDMDLIIIGTQGVWHPPETPGNRIAEQVIRCAPCPVLIVRNKNPAWVSSRKSRYS